MTSVLVRVCAAIFAALVGFEIAALYLGWFFSCAYGVFSIVVAIFLMIDTASTFEECDRMREVIRECDNAIRWCREERLRLLRGGEK